MGKGDGGGANAEDAADGDGAKNVCNLGHNDSNRQLEWSSYDNYEHGKLKARDNILHYLNFGYLADNTFHLQSSCCEMC